MDSGRRAVLTRVVLPALALFALTATAAVALSGRSDSPEPSAVTAGSPASDPGPGATSPSRSPHEGPPEPVDPPGTLLWTGSYDQGNFDEFRASDNEPAAPELVDDPVRDGKFAGAYVVPDGGQRCESVPDVDRFEEGDDLWFSWSTQLAPGFPLDQDTWQVITQWKNDGVGSPPIQVNVRQGEYLLDGGYGWPGDTFEPDSRYGAVSLGPAEAGVWVDWLVHVKFSSHADVGFVSVVRDGEQVVEHWHMPGGTLYPGLPSYLKLGYYRDADLGSTATVYHDSWKIGTTRAAVS